MGWRDVMEFASEQQITYKQVIVAGLLKITVSMMNERRVKRRAIY